MEFTLPLSIDGHASFFLEEDLVFNFTFAGKDALRQHTPSPSCNFAHLIRVLAARTLRHPSPPTVFLPLLTHFEKGILIQFFHGVSSLLNNQYMTHSIL